MDEGAIPSTSTTHPAPAERPGRTCLTAAGANSTFGYTTGVRTAGKSILVVEDDEEWQQLVRLWLKAAKYQDVRCAVSAQQALRQALARPPDCVILDLQLADAAGTEVVKKLRASPETALVPVLMMTSRGAEMANCLRSGADHFIAKSPNGEELLATLEALFRRRDLDNRLTRRGDLAYRPDTRQVYVGDAPAAVLTPKAFALLVTLVERSPAPVGRTELSAVIGKHEDPGLSRALDILVNRLRKALPGKLGRRVRAVRGFGYAYVVED